MYAVLLQGLNGTLANYTKAVVKLPKKEFALFSQILAVYNTTYTGAVTAASG